MKKFFFNHAEATFMKAEEGFGHSVQCGFRSKGYGLWCSGSRVFCCV